MPPRVCRQVQLQDKLHCSDHHLLHVVLGQHYVRTQDCECRRLDPRTVEWSVPDLVTLPLLCESSDKSRADSGSLPLSVLRHLNTPCPHKSPPTRLWDSKMEICSCWEDLSLTFARGTFNSHVRRQVHCKTSCIAQTTTCSTLSWANITFVPRTVSAGDSILGQLSGVFQTW